MDTTASGLSSPNSKARTARPGPGRAVPWIDFLGSMNLAITLLMVLAIAAIIGTVLQQNQPYNDYVIKFGPFWFEVYRFLGLYDVYHAIWFLLILVFLVISTSVCIYRQTPNMLREMRDWGGHLREQSLKVFPLNRVWSVSQTPGDVLQQLRPMLHRAGYRTRLDTGQQKNLLSAKRGTANRLGYIATHVAIVVISVGGLLDGNIPLLIDEWRGKLVLETRDIPANQVGEKSWLPKTNSSFRGRITVPEGRSANIIFLNVRDGYLVQELPFTVKIKEFRIEHYNTGQPKSFETDLVIIDPDLDKPIEQTISVNNPLSHKGITIYQASFGDGGSELKLRAWPLSPAGDDGKIKPLELEGKINTDTDLVLPDGKRVLEFDDFKKYNVINVSKNPKKIDFKNQGPSVLFKLRDPDGGAVEFQNYMSPIDVEGRLFMLSGMRTAVADPFQYLHIPVGPDGSVKRFMSLLSALRNPTQRRKVADEIADATSSVQKSGKANLRETIVDRTEALLALFARGGFLAIQDHVEDKVPESDRARVFEAFLNIVRVGVGSLYRQQLGAEGVDISRELSQTDQLFFGDALTALAALPSYQSPVYLELVDFKHIEASGLEMTRSPGKYIVYWGCGALIIGVFLLFYARQRRLWLHIKPDSGGSELIFAGSDLRNSPDFAREFEQLGSALETVSTRA